jgi:deoxyribonuclease-4
MLQIGLKMWSVNTDILIPAVSAVQSGTFQFIELTPIPGTGIAPFLNDEVPYIIHIPPDKYGMNLADARKYDLNCQIYRLCTDWADQLQASHVILHPGHGTFEVAKDFLQNLDDPRILLENMTRYDINLEDMVGYLPSELSELMDGKFGFCFDFSHAIKTALILGEDYSQFLAKFLPLNPQVIHLSDAHLDNDIDEHLDIGDGDYDWPFLVEYIKQCHYPPITLETPRKAGSLSPNVAEADYLRDLAG